MKINTIDVYLFPAMHDNQWLHSWFSTRLITGQYTIGVSFYRKCVTTLSEQNCNVCNNLPNEIPNAQWEVCALIIWEFHLFEMTCGQLWSFNALLHQQSGMRLKGNFHTLSSILIFNLLYLKFEDRAERDSRFFEPSENPPEVPNTELRVFPNVILRQNLDWHLGIFETHPNAPPHAPWVMW